ncbi:glycoside hydrolase family 3 N-terminal domain-containing protein [Actinoplanes sp. NPDC051851]|uniref:glycoside hydrolase family 3 N-terminal domain-containing protein n=1 Tax=Actinoplanes sp. NPDC051851 TaxID=3154753 RepID=UPI00342DC96E
MSIDPALRRLALNTLLAAFPGTTAPGWARDLLADGLAGHTLFGSNVADPEQLARLTAELRAARPDAVIAIDEEGGDVTRLGHRTGSAYPGNAALGAVDDPGLTREVYAAIGHELAAAGVTLNLAPDVDVNTAARNPIIGTRAFGAETALVARHTGAAVEGLQSAGVAACAKHFPGHGATVTDSHLELPTVDEPLSVLRERDLPPFAAAIAAGTRAIMSAHIRVPELTGDAPATFSRAALTGLLRGEYGFTGVIVTDALEMRGAAGTAARAGAAGAGGGRGTEGAAGGGVPRAAVAALAAGADLLCVGAVVDRELVEATAGEIAEGVRDGRLPLERFEDAVERTRGMAGENAARQPAGRGPEACGLVAARRALLVEGDVTAMRKALVVRLVTGHSIAEGRVPWGLRPFLGGREQIDAVAGEVTPESLIARAGGRPILLVGRRVHQGEATRELARGLAAAHPTGVLEMGWPSAWRPAGVRAFLVTHGASLVSARAAAEALWGHPE